MAKGPSKLHSLAVVALALVLPAQAEARDPRCSGVAEAGQTEAREILAALEKAEARIKSDYGANVLNGVPEVATKSGVRSIGEVWHDYLIDAGYPNDFLARTCLSSDLIALGLSDEAAFTLASGQANGDAVDKLKSDLRKIN